MSSEALLSNVIPFAGSGLLGYALGFEKDLEVDANHRRFPGWYVLCRRSTFAKTRLWDKLGNDTSTQMQYWATDADITNLHGIFHTLGIAVSGGLGLGLLAGFARNGRAGSVFLSILETR
jgi:hypothetical protein